MPQYDPSKVFVTFAGVPISGFAPGTFVEITFDEESFFKQTGADGHTARALNSNLGAKVKMTLQQHSLSNDFLSGRWLLDRQGLGSGPLLVKDLLGTTLAIAEEAWVLKLPDTAFGKELGTREWMLDSGRLDAQVGGSL